MKITEKTYRELKSGTACTYGNYAKPWAEEHSNDFSDYSMLDNVIDNNIEHMACISETGIEIIIF